MIPRRFGSPVDVLLVEDNPGDVRLIRDAFTRGQVDTALHVVRDGKAALDYLYQRGEHAKAIRPDLVLMDLNVPKVNGFDVLADIRDDDALRMIPVVILTGSSAEGDITRGYKLHANAYVTKPFDPAAFDGVVRTLEEFWLTLVQLPTWDG